MPAHKGVHGAHVRDHHAQVPYENYRKIFRTSQKQIEREMGPVQTGVAKLAKDAEAGSLDSTQAIESIDAMIARVEGLKRKVRCVLPS